MGILSMLEMWAGVLTVVLVVVMFIVGSWTAWNLWMDLSGRRRR